MELKPSHPLSLTLIKVEINTYELIINIVGNGKPYSSDWEIVL